MSSIGKVVLVCWLILVSLTAAVAARDNSSSSRLLMGTGGTDGVYYPVGIAICRLVTREIPDLLCLARSTGGSIANLKALGAGELDLAVVQSDWQYHAYQTGVDGQPPLEQLRALFSLHGEPFTVVALKSSGIRTLNDLKGRRVNVGNPGSGQRSTLEVLLKTLGWTLEDFGKAGELEAGDQARAMCDNQVEAIVYTVGHPNRSLLEATLACDSRLVPVTGAAVDRLLAEHPYYVRTRIPGGMYRGNPRDTATFGVKATLLATTRTPEDTVYRLIKTLFTHLEELRELHPALKELNPQVMLREGITVPLHPGARRYYREAGLLSEED